ncbi:MAG: tetratricopeptide repeat protein, partial [Anaerolineales bacterium]
ALELDPDALVANTLLALFWQRRGDFDEALQVLDRLTAIYPDNPALLAELGNTLAQDGDLESAMDAYRSAVELAPGKADYWRLLAGFSVGYEYLVNEVGLPAARRAAAINPADPANLDMLGQALLLLEDFASAERFFRRSLDADPAYALGHVHLGLVYVLRDEHIRARDQWKQVLETAPGTLAADQAQRLLENYFP